MNRPIGRNILRGAAGMATLAAALLPGASAQAQVTISTGQTQGMACSSGICQPTSATAVLNVTDLENYLAAGNLEVTTAGSGVDAEDIDIETALTWSDSSALSLVATQAIRIDQRVSVTSAGGLSLTTDGQIQDFVIGRTGNVSFSSLSSSLSINGDAYTLVNTVKSLAKAIAKNPSGDFALATSYDAKHDRTYTANPVSTELEGTFEGLGNVISHLTINAKGNAGMFDIIDVAGVLRDVGVHHINARGTIWVGGLASVNDGIVWNCFATGFVSQTGRSGEAGGLLGGISDTGMVENSYSTASVKGGVASSVGGLAGGGGTILESFATGSVSGGGQVGGLVGATGGNQQIENSYATGPEANVRSRDGTMGGLVGTNDLPISSSYSTGKVADQDCGCYAGGLIGADGAPKGSLSSDYWDLDTSGISDPSQGAGYPRSDPGITGLTTQQFQSGLPSGFDPTIWGQNSSINKGYPYLLANPPP